MVFRAGMQIAVLALRHQLAVLPWQTKESARLRTTDLAMGHPFATMDPVARGVGHRQAGNSNCVAAIRVWLNLAVEEDGREVR